jgi:VIT1/CCC1 family predicted Fe2+/Mn2+ transporter
MESKIKATEEQVAYAWLLDWGMKIGLAMLVVTFGMYLLGVMKPYVPVENLVNGDWALPVHGKKGHPGYLEKENIQAGWWWLSQVGKGDFANFIGIAFLAGVTIVCYIRILPILFSRKDWIYSVIAVLEVLVLSLAASGLLRGGGH